MQPPRRPEASLDGEGKEGTPTEQRNQQAVDLFGNDMGAAVFTLILLVFGLLSGENLSF